MEPTTRTHFREIQGQSHGFYILLSALGVLTAIGLSAAYYMEHHGHIVTGMNNQIVWGAPHIFAVFLILAAPGALSVASMTSVFGRTFYKPLARLSGLLAIALLIGGLAVLVLDLGRPDRLIVAMTYYNFKSIFAWNIFLYTGFIAIVIVYLWTMFARRIKNYDKSIGLFAFIWRVVLTTGTGSIFGFLVARSAYDTALLAPLFIVMSFAYGLAVFTLTLLAAYRWSGRPLGDEWVQQLKNLLGMFTIAVLYFLLIYHLTNLYITERHGIERFLLLDGGIYPALFWIGQVILGGMIPLFLFYHPRLGRLRTAITLGAILVILGGLAQLTIIIIGGQAYPLQMFPGKEVTSLFFDGTVNSYTPSLPEILLGVGGIALALSIVTVAIRILPFLPDSLAKQETPGSAKSAGT